MKNKKIFIVCFIVIFAVFVVGAIILGSQKITIDLYEADVFIDDSGNMDVSETWVLDYPSGYNVRFRDIAFSKNHRQNPLTSGLNTSLDQPTFEKESVSVDITDLDSGKDITDEVRIGYSFNGDRDELGKPIECPAGLGSYCESIFTDFTGYGGLKGKVSFTYTYRINGAVTKYSDISELNWVFFSEMEGKVKRAKVNITLPVNNLNKEEISTWGHGLSNGMIDIESNNKITVVAKNITENEELELRVVFPNLLVPNINSKHSVNGLLKDKIFAYEKDLADKTNRQVMFVNIINVVTVLTVIATIVSLIYIYKKYDKEYEAKFNQEYLRELPSEINPSEVSYLINFGRIQDEDVSATLLDLIRRKVLFLEDKGVGITADNPDFDIYLNKEYDLNSLYQYEIKLINFFIKTIGNGEKVNTKEIKVYGKKYVNAQKLENFSSDFAKSIKNEFANKNYFENTKDKLKGFSGIVVIVQVLLLVMMFIVGSTFNIEPMINILVMFILIIVTVIYLSTIKRRTVYGNEENAKWLAFKRFLENFGNFKDYPMPGIIIWEHYLVYATVFKIADKVMSQLRVKVTEISANESDSTFMYGWCHYHYAHNNFFIINNLNRTYSQAKTTAMSTISAHNSSSGGHGGGFSGGSSFGGGGGGGRSR